MIQVSMYEIVYFILAVTSFIKSIAVIQRGILTVL